MADGDLQAGLVDVLDEPLETVGEPFRKAAEDVDVGASRLEMFEMGGENEGLKCKTSMRTQPAGPSRLIPIRVNP